MTATAQALRLLPMQGLITLAGTNRIGRRVTPLRSALSSERTDPKRRTMFTASCLLKTQPRVRGKCLLYRYGSSPAVTSKHHYGLADRSRCARPVASVAMQSQIHPWHNAGLPNQMPRSRHEAEPVRRVGLPSAATAALCFSSERTPGEHFLGTSSP